MYHEDAEMLFPLRVAPSLRDLRGLAWRRLVDRIERRLQVDRRKHFPRRVFHGLQREEPPPFSRRSDQHGERT